MYVLVWQMERRMCSYSRWSTYADFVGAAVATAYNVTIQHLKGITFILMLISQLNALLSFTFSFISIYNLLLDVCAGMQ